MSKELVQVGSERAGTVQHGEEKAPGGHINTHKYLMGGNKEDRDGFLSGSQ